MTNVAPPDYIPVLVGGGIGALASFVGVFFGGLGANRRQRRLLRRQAALEVAEVERLLPQATGLGYYELETKLQRVDVLLVECDVPEPLRRAFIELSQACWRDNSVHLEMQEEPGFDADRMNARRRVLSILRSWLLKSRSRDDRKTMNDVVAQARQCLPESFQALEDSSIFW